MEAGVNIVGPVELASWREFTAVSCEAGRSGNISAEFGD